MLFLDWRHRLNADAPAETNNNYILATKEEVWAVSDLLVAIYEEEAAAAK